MNDEFEAEEGSPPRQRQHNEYGAPGQMSADRVHSQSMLSDTR